MLSNKLKNRKGRRTLFLIIVCLAMLNLRSFAQDRNFHIYLCFGQSNMVGTGPIESMDKMVDSRFKVFQALDCSNLNRESATWYTAVPPISQCYSSLSPADYFGRTMVANLPDSITVGVINVSVAGCDIRLFDKDIYMDYDSTYEDSWFTSQVVAYDGYPYQYLIDLAKLAQEDGVIKGILLHQGEANTGQAEWPSYVKKIYNDMLDDLSLNANAVPLLAGEVLAVDGNCCSSMNPIIQTLPDVIPTAHIISSSGCTGQDAAHFDSPGYRKLGKRYGVEMLSLLGYEAEYTEAECGTVGANLKVLADNNASDSACVKSIRSISTSPSENANIVKIDVSLSSNTTYYLYGRFKSGIDGKSFWFKIDNGEFELFDNLATEGWEWIELKGLNLTAGDHSISFALSDVNVMLDKIVIKNSQIKPVDIGEETGKACNYQETDQEVTGLGAIITEDSDIKIYPNPASDCITIQSRDFSYDKVELIDMTGNIVLLKSATNGSEIQLPVNLINGVYTVKISKKNQYRFKKIIIHT